MSTLRTSPTGPPAEISDAGRRAVARVAAEFSSRLDEVRGAVDARIRTDIPELVDTPVELLESLERSTAAHVTLIGGMLGSWASPSAASVPPEAIEWGREFVRHGIPLEALLRAYRLGHAEMWRQMQTIVAAQIHDVELIAEVYGATSAFLFSYVDAALEPIIEEHIAEQRRLAQLSQSLIQSELRRVLGGESTDPEAASGRLNYRLDGWHIGFVAWTITPDGDEHGDALDRVGDAIRAGAPGARLLAVRVAPTTLHGWVGAREPLPELPTPPAGVGIALGEPAHGLDGFRRTHEQAQLARRVVRLSDSPGTTVTYRNSAALALLTSDLDHARVFVQEVLGAMLARNDSAMLLRTVAVYQQEALSLNRAAARLHVHPNTVSYRVRRVLEVTGETDAGSLRLRAAIAIATLVLSA